MLVYLATNWDHKVNYVHEDAKKVEAIYNDWKECGYNCSKEVADTQED